MKPIAVVVCGMMCLSSRAALAQPPSGCAGLPDHDKLKSQLSAVVKEGKDANGGMGNHQWAVVVNRDGQVCAVVFSGPDRGAQWPGSRMIAAEKANTANALSSPGFALSTANLWAGSQPGQSLYSLATALPPNPAAAFAGSPGDIGETNDPLVGKVVGGVIVFGGGLALYDNNGKLLGGLGVSGDTSCSDHIVAWKIRHALNLDAVPAGVAPQSNDNLILDVNKNGESASGFGHPTCKGARPPDEVIRQLSSKYPTGKEP